MAVIDELFVKLGYDVDQEKVDTFNAGVEATSRLMKRVAIGGIAAATAIVAFTKKMTTFQNLQTQIGKNLDLPVKLTQAWQDAAEDIGIDAGKAISALTKIRTIQEELAVGKKPSAEFLRGLNQIGLSLADIQGLSSSDALLKISSGLSKLDGVAKGGAASLLGLRDELNFIGDARLSKLVSDNINNIDTSGLTELTTQWANFTQAGRNAALSLANEIAPSIGSALDTISSTLDDLRKNFGGFLQAIANDEINPIDDAATKLDDFVFGAWRDAFSKLMDSDVVKQFSGMVNGALVNPLSGLPSTFSGGAASFAGVGAGGANIGGAGDNTTNITNNVQMDITTNDPAMAGRVAAKEIERGNQKAITNMSSVRKN